MGFPIKFDSVKSGWSIVYIEGSQVIISQKYYISFSLRFCLSNSADPNQGSYRQVLVKFKEFSSTSKRLSNSFQGLKVNEKYQSKC